MHHKVYMSIASLNLWIIHLIQQSFRIISLSIIMLVTMLYLATPYCLA